MKQKPDGETRIFVIVGDPVAQVKSPAGLSTILADRGINALVIPAHVAPTNFVAWFAGLRLQQNLDGIIVTIPHKSAALAHCDQLTDRARIARSVNIMRRMHGDTWLGDNSDGQGFLDGIESRGFAITGKRVLLVGAGGAGAAIAYETLKRGAAFLALLEIDLARRDSIVERLGTVFPGKIGLGSHDPCGFDLVANATPLGMQNGDPLPVDTSLLASTQFVADVVTMPAMTPLIAAAVAAGCPHMPGSGMFEAQAPLLIDLLVGEGPVPGSVRP